MGKCVFSRCLGLIVPLHLKFIFFLCNTQSFLVLCTVINYPLTSERLTQGKEKKVHPEKNIYKESSTCLKIRFV